MPIESLRDIQRAAVSAFAGGGGGAFTESDTAPASPAVGDRWFHITSGILYTRLTPGIWVELAAISTAAESSGSTGDSEILSWMI